MGRIDFESHKEHLAVVSSKVVKQKMDYFRLKDVRLEELPFKCRSFMVHQPVFEEYHEWVHPLDPVSLDDIKNWFGIPNKIAKGMLAKTSVVSGNVKFCSREVQVTPKALPTKADWDYKGLDSEQRSAIHQMSRNLLYGYVSIERQKSVSIQGVVNHMLEMTKMKDVKIFTASDLVICPDEVVEFNNLAALYFNNILIYNNGILKTKGNTSIHAVQIKHVSL